jgi:hypothetical protein
MKDLLHRACQLTANQKRSMKSKGYWSNAMQTRETRPKRQVVKYIFLGQAKTAGSGNLQQIQRVT